MDVDEDDDFYAPEEATPVTQEQPATANAAETAPQIEQGELEEGEEEDDEEDDDSVYYLGHILADYHSNNLHRISISSQREKMALKPHLPRKCIAIG